MMAGAFTGVESVVPLLLTLQHGWSATVAGLPLTATALTWAGASWWLGRHGDGPLVGVLRVGFALLVAGVLGVAWLASASTPPWTAFVIWPVAGLGAGLVVPSAAILLLAATNDADRGRDAAALQLSDSCLGALGTGIAGALVAAAAAGTISYRAAFACTALGLSLAALAGALLAGRGRPAGAVR
jgi:MFS family permease